MKRLLDDNVHGDNAAKVTWTRTKAKEDDSQVARIRVVTAKYKVYIVLFLIFICILLLKYIPDINKSYKSNKDSFNQVQTQLKSVQDEIKLAENDMQFLGEIENNEESLKTCLNDEDKRDVCRSLPDNDNWATWEWENKQYDLTVPLSYLQVHSLYNNKMPVDEKKVLKNLNEYLIKQDIAWGSKARVWDILKISIWDPSPVKKGDTHFFSVPVKVTIEFTTIGDLTWFLYNVEKKMIDSWEDRILYKIQSVSYDIISSDEPQVTDISMLAYYYYDERFENVNIDSNSGSQVQDNQNSNTQENKSNNNKSSSNSFFSKIFGS